MISYSFQGFGVMRADYVLDADALDVNLPGPQLGKRLTQGRVPLSQLRGFFVENDARIPSAGGRAVMTAGKQLGALGNGKLVVAWQDGERLRRRRYHMVNVADPKFCALVDELARRRPEADLRRLPIADARRRVGMRDEKKMIAIVIVVLLVVVFAIGAITQLVR
jgi:hypothetical protein